jgi:hypothetical protein
LDLVFKLFIAFNTNNQIESLEHLILNPKKKGRQPRRRAARRQYVP